MKHAVVVAFAAAALWGAAPAAAQQAQYYPLRPVKVIASSSAGGISDIFIRVLGDELQKKWGHPLVVENRPGGSFNIGARACADAIPDGHTICILPADVLQYNRFLFKSLNYDLFEDLEPITLLFYLNQVLAVSAALNVSTLRRACGAVEGQARHAELFGAGGAAPDLPRGLEAAHRRRHRAGAVPRRRRGGQRHAHRHDAGHLHRARQPDLAPARRHHQGHRDRRRASARRCSPNIPTLKDVGATDEVTQADFSLWAPKGTPKALIRKVHDDVVAIANNHSFRDRFVIQRGLDPVFSTPEEFAAYLQRAKTRRGSDRQARQPAAAIAIQEDCKRKGTTMTLAKLVLPAIDRAARCAARVGAGQLSGASGEGDHHHERRRPVRHLHARARRRAAQALGPAADHREPPRRRDEPRHARLRGIAARRLHDLHHQCGRDALQPVPVQDDPVQPGNEPAADHQRVPPHPYAGGELQARREECRRARGAVEAEGRHA